jgi:hypothetical protein
MLVFSVYDERGWVMGRASSASKDVQRMHVFYANER